MLHESVICSTCIFSTVGPSVHTLLYWFWSHFASSQAFILVLYFAVLCLSYFSTSFSSFFFFIFKIMLLMITIRFAVFKSLFVVFSKIAYRLTSYSKHLGARTWPIRELIWKKQTRCFVYFWLKKTSTIKRNLKKKIKKKKIDYHE